MKTTASRASAVSQTRGFGDLLYDKAGARPSLDLDFAGTGSLRDKVTGEHLVDHTRNSSGTFINSEGLVESSYANLLAGSENLSESATYPINHSGTAVLVDNTDGVYTPRGQLAKLLKPNQSGTQPLNNSVGKRQNPRITWNNNLGQAGFTITKSIYAKMQTGGPRYLTHFGWAGQNVSTVNVKWDLQEGVVHGNQNYYPDTQTSRDRTSWGISDEGGGWYRCWVTIINTSQHPSVSFVMNKSGATSTSDDFYYDDTSWDINKGIYIAHAQLNKGQLKDYIPTPDNTYNHSPRFTHERVETGNKLLDTYRFSNNWNNSNTVTLEPYAGLAPDGTYSALKIVNNTGNYGQLNDPTMLREPGKTYTLSAYVKTTGNSSHFNLWAYGTGVGYIVQTGKTATPTDWTRYELTFTVPNAPVTIGFDNAGGNWNSEFLFWGVQLEEADSASTYVPSIDTFTSRLGNATYVDSAGLVKTAYRNHLTYSEQLDNSFWTKMAGSIQANAAVAPDGTNTADKYIPDTANVISHLVFNSVAPRGAMSVFAKANELTHITLIAQKSGYEVSYALFNLSNGTIETTHDATAKILDVGNGWYRCIVYPQRTDAIGFMINPSYGGTPDPNNFGRITYAGNNSDSIYLWGAQLTDNYNNEGDYVKTEATSTGAARYSHDPETLTPTGLYLEPAATNVCKAPLFFDNTGNIRWNGTTNTSFTANAAIAPDGTQTATLVKPNDTTSFPYVSGGNASATYVWSGFFKSAGYRYVHLWQHKSNSSRGIIFDIIDGTITHNFVSSSQTGFIQKYPNGWFRIGVKETASNFNGNFGFTLNKHPDGTNVNIYGRNTDLDDFDSGVYAWGLNRTEEEYLSSPIIHTVFADVTRAADVYTSTANLTETFEPRGLLIEEARTNVVPYSENFNVSDWNKNHTNLAGQVTSPMGDNTAYNVVPIDNSNYHRINLPFTATTNTYTGSVFVKPNGYRYLHLRLEGGSVNNVGHGFDLQEGIGITGRYNGSLSLSSTSHSIEKYPNGWFKVSVTGNLTSGNGYMGLQISNSPNTTASNATGNSTLGMHIWGAQLETGSFPTSYIPTSGSSATRAVDVTSISGDNFGTYRTNILSSSKPIPYNASNQSSTRHTNIPYVPINQNVILEPYAALAPDGTFSAAKLTFLTSNAAGDGTMQYSINNPNNTAAGTFSFYARTISGTAKIRIKMGVNTTTASGGEFTVTDQWQRFERYHTAAGIHFGINNHLSSQIGTSILVWGFQREEGVTKATNFIPSTDTFVSRASSATYVDSNGLIKTSKVNYLKNSKMDDLTHWQKGGATTFTPNFAIAPDGTQTAHRVQHAATSGTYINQSVTQTVGKSYVLSVWMKRNGSDTHFRLYYHNTYEDIEIPQEWTRISRTWTQAQGTSQFQFDNTGGANDYLIWHPQLEEGTTPTDYVETSSTASGGPRYSHDPETLIPTGLYLEPARTNFFRTWTNNNNTSPNIPYITYSANGQGGQAQISTEVTAPDGTDKTLKVSWDNYGSTGHGYFRIGNSSSSTQGLGTLNAGTYTFSFFIKRGNDGNHNADDLLDGTYGAGNASYQVIFQDFSESPQGPHINIQNPNVNKRIVKYPNGWYRVSTSFTTSQSYAFDNAGVSHYTLNTANLKAYYEAMPIYYWGFQLEAGSYETSHIDQGYLSQITRAADTYTSTATTVLDRDGGNKEAFWNRTGTSVFAQTKLKNVGSIKPYGRLWQLSYSNTYSQNIQFDNNNLSFKHNVAAGNFNFGAAHNLSDGDTVKTGYAFQLNDGKAILNGSSLNTAVTLPLHTPTDSKLPDFMDIGRNGYHNNSYTNNPISRITFWKTRLPDASLINITKL